ncbi:MAG: hypothetical protein IPJ81_04710 [Chitinophagaceae bacterium]|nr:hypothetical protein [Chitinophagaceae bacterium]
MIYPKTNFVRDTTEFYYGERHFKSINGKSRIEIIPETKEYDSLSKSYDNYLKSIKENYTAGKVVFGVLKPTYYVISWRDNRHIYYTKKWQLKTGNLVCIHFSYEDSEKALFDKIIPHMVNYNPDCW